LSEQLQLQAGALAAHLATLRHRRPLIHHLTNIVVANVTANATLALGASPIMAAAREEVEEVAARADAVVLNLGTLSPALVEAMIAAGRAANRHGKPVVLDPVGYGFTRLRTESTRRILDQVQVAVIRGNRSEIALLAGGDAEVRGVDAAGEEEGEQLDEVALRLAERVGAVIAMTGRVDRVAGQGRLVRIHNGHPALTRVTGTGCMATSVVAAFVAAAPQEALPAAVAALGTFGLAGEQAAARSEDPGSFQTFLLDALYRLTPDDLRQGLRVEVVA